MMPTTCKMPVVQLASLTGPLLLVCNFFGPGPLSSGAAQMRVNVARLADKALHEYTRARRCMVDQIAEDKRPTEQLLQGRDIHMFEFIDQMENCIGSVRRALRYIEALRADTTAPKQDKLKRRAAESRAKELTAVRNTVEHLDKRIAQGAVVEGEPIALRLTADEKGVQLGGEVLSFDALAHLIRYIHQIAVDLLDVGPARFHPKTDFSNDVDLPKA